MKITLLIIFLFFITNIFPFCSEDHGTGDHCDHVYRICLGYGKYKPKNRAACLAACLSCKGLSSGNAYGMIGGAICGIGALGLSFF